MIANQVDSYGWISSTLPQGPAGDLFNTINGLAPSKPVNVFNVLQSYHNEKHVSKDEVKKDPAFVNLFLQYPNRVIHDLAMEIVNPNDSDDLKVWKIQDWVVNNITYETDESQYGYDELWVPPVMLLKTMKGDCEDGAFLIMSLALNAGVDPKRLQFYGGEVKAGEGAATGGHGWVAYQRESDEEWVPIDFSYYPDLRPMDKRIPMRLDERYIKQYFIFDVNHVIQSDENRVREPTTYTDQGYMTPNVLLPGWLLNTYA